MATGGGKKAIIAAFFANLGIAIAKVFGFVITGSASMLAEAVHSGADASNQGLLLLGSARATRQPTAVHPFGYGRERYFWSFVVALVLFTLGSLFALYEGIEKLRHPHAIESILVAVVILVIAIGLESFSLRTAVIESRHAKGDASWWSFIRHSKSPELPVVLLEDVGAFIGLILALTGVGMAEITGNPRYDAAGTIAIGLLLGVIAIILVIEMKSLLIGEAATPETVERIGAAMTADASVGRVIHMRTLHIGPEELLVAAKVELTGNLAGTDVARAIDRIEGAIREAAPEARVIYIEPDVARSEGPDADSDSGTRH